MPRIDDVKTQEKIFKKKEYRSWDPNLLKKLDLKRISKKEEKAKFYQGSDKVQQGFNQGSDKVQQGFNQGSDKVQQGFNQGSDKVQLNPNIRVQSGFISDQKIIKKLIERLGGNEKKIFLYIINLCSIKGTLSTGAISGKELNTAISTTRNGRETAIKRLANKKLIKRNNGKAGLNGKLDLCISELIKTEALIYMETYSSEQALLLSNQGSTKVQNNHENKVQLGFNSKHTSSSNNINTTTSLPDEWRNINFESLRTIGFSENQLKQLYEKNLNSPEIIQASIYHFSFGIEINEKIKSYKEPLNVLMGVLRKGQAWIEPKYKSSQEIALEQLIEIKKIETERIKKLNEEAKKTSCEEWLNSLSEIEKEALLPTKEERIGGEGFKLACLRNYFKEHVWPTKKEKFLNSK